MPTARQTNFSAGELAPALWGRTDLPIFMKGARKLRNFFTTRNGAAMTRPGTTYVATTKANASGDLGRVRLIPFIAGDDRALVLEFGNNYIRFFYNGGIVIDPATGNPYEIASPYAWNDLPTLKWAQTGDVMTICNPGWDPFELRLLSFAPPSFSLTAVRFAPYEPYWADIAAPHAPTVGFTMVLPADWKAATAYVVGDRVIHGAHTYECTTAGVSGDGVSLGQTGPTGTAAQFLDNTVVWKCLEDATHTAREWLWMFTAIVQDKTTGAIYETLGTLVTQRFQGGEFGTATGYDTTAKPLNSNSRPVAFDRPVTFRRAETSGLLSTPEGWDSYVVLAYNAYRGRGDVLGWIGQTKTREFVDLGDAPNLAIQPPLGSLPFGTELEASGGPRHKDRPAAVAFFQERRIFAGLTRHSTQWVASKTGAYTNYDTRLDNHVAGEALLYELAARRRESIRSLLALERLLMFTNAAVWNVGGTQGSPLDFDSIDARVIDEVGATDLQPLLVDGSAIFARAKGTGARALVPQGQEFPYSGVDISLVAEHLFLGKNRGLADWTYAEDPWGLVWAVRDDGLLLSLTYSRNGWAWAHHDTDGYVRSVCAIPEGDEDAVYLAVVRNVNGAQVQYVERMTSRVRRGVTTDATTGETIVDPNAGAEFTLPLAVSKAPDDVCLDCAAYYLGNAVRTITGLTHLKGRSVWVIGPNRMPEGPFVVSAAGEVDLGAVPAANVTTIIGPKLLVYVGLKFTPDLETLAIAAGDARLRKKIVERVAFEVDQSFGVLVGQDFDHLTEPEPRTADVDGYDAISAASALLDVPVEGSWDQEARAVLRQDSPLPVTVLGISRGLAFGE